MSYWAVVRSLPKREISPPSGFARMAASRFFCPGADEARLHAVVLRYLFCRIVDRWRSINSTLGVLCLVRTGDCPARCPDREIDSLKAMIDGHGYIKLPEAPPPPVRRKIAIGARVRIASGPFGGKSGLYAGMGTKDREKILLNLLGSQRPVLVPSNLIIPAQ